MCNSYDRLGSTDQYSDFGLAADASDETRMYQLDSIDPGLQLGAQDSIQNAFRVSMDKVTSREAGKLDNLRPQLTPDTPFCSWY